MISFTNYIYTRLEILQREDCLHTKYSILFIPCVSTSRPPLNQDLPITELYRTQSSRRRPDTRRDRLRYFSPAPALVIRACLSVSYSYSISGSTDLLTRNLGPLQIIDVWLGTRIYPQLICCWTSIYQPYLRHHWNTYFTLYAMLSWLITGASRGIGFSVVEDLVSIFFCF